LKYYVAALKKYAVFAGRATKKEFWMFVLFNFLVACVAGLADYIFGTTYGDRGTGIITSLYSLAIFVPSLAIAVRRFHDIGKSAWWIFIGFVPLIGQIWYLVLMLKSGDTVENAYGPVPVVE